MSDGNLRSIFRRNLPKFFWASVECPLEPGIPDAYFCGQGANGWIEFKQTTSKKIASLTAEQVAWHDAHYRKGGRSFFFVRRGRELYGFKNWQGKTLLKNGLAAPSLVGLWSQPWSWEEIEQVLINV